MSDWIERAGAYALFLLSVIGVNRFTTRNHERRISSLENEEKDRPKQTVETCGKERAADKCVITLQLEHLTTNFDLHRIANEKSLEEIKQNQIRDKKELIEWMRRVEDRIKNGSKD